MSDGLVLVDKPPGWTSHDVVARVRRLAGTRKVGHAGTLDPMATGVLVLGVNKATRLLTYLVGAGKTYTATIRLGVATVTDDAEGEAMATVGAVAVDENDLRAAITGLSGPIQQVPSAVSAIKVDGKRSYARVRSGEEVTLAPRAVTVDRFDVLDVRRASYGSTPVLDVDVEIDCSSGTYVRALARDLGDALDVGAHLNALRRTRVGPFEVAACRSLDDLAERFRVLPLPDAARQVFPVRQISASEALALRHGKTLDPSGTGPAPVAVLDPDGVLVALIGDTGSQARSLVVFPS